jgi:transposase
MLLQSILRRVHPIPGFVYGRAELRSSRRGETVRVALRARRRSKAICSGCGSKRRGYDRLDEREFAFVPLWGIIVHLVYALRRVDCPKCGVVVEMVPWATGKSR